MPVKNTVKEQVTLLKDSAKYQAVKLHVRRNKKFYMGLGTGALIVLATRKPVINVVSSPIFNNNNLPIFNNDNSSLVNFGGRSTKIVKRLSDGKIWEKASLAAAEAGVDAAYMSRHLNGKKPDIFGETYKIVGIATTG